MQVTKKLADFVVNTTYENFPPEAVEQAKVCLLDFLGVALAAGNEPITEIISRFLRYCGGNPRCSVIGMDLRTSAPLAALANGALGHMLDYDDTNPSMMAHPSVQMFPAALALGEEYQLSGSKIIEGFVVGLEVSAKIGRSINPGHVQRGWFPVGTLGTIGAAASCAKILDLKQERVRIAFGIAANLAAGVRRNSGTMTKALTAGLASQNGLTAAKLAQEGCTAALDIIEAPLGFCHNFSGESVDYDLMLRGLGAPYEIVEPGVSFKRYPCCARAHPSIDALLTLLKKYQLTPEKVKSLICRLSSLNQYILVYSRPNTGSEGKFSLEYCLARALAGGKLELDDFTNEKVKEPNIITIMSKISVIYEEGDIDKQGNWRKTTVTIETTDGRTLTEKHTGKKKDGILSLNESWIQEKFRRCARVVLSQVQVGWCLEMVKNLERLKNIKILMELVGRSSTALLGHPFFFQ